MGKEKIAVHITTVKQGKIASQFAGADENWFDADMLERHKKENKKTCISIGLNCSLMRRDYGWCNKEWYLKEGYKVITFTEFEKTYLKKLTKYYIY